MNDGLRTSGNDARWLLNLGIVATCLLVGAIVVSNDAVEGLLMAVVGVVVVAAFQGLNRRARIRQASIAWVLLTVALLLTVPGQPALVGLAIGSFLWTVATLAT